MKSCTPSPPWKDGERHGDTRHFGDHADFHDLGLDLREARLQSPSAGFGRNTGRPHERVDDIADAEHRIIRF